MGAGERSRYSDCAMGWTVRRSNPGGGWDFPHPSRPALGPTQPPIKQAPGLFPGVKRPGSGADHPPPSSAKVEWPIELKNKRPTWCHLLFYFTSYVLNMFRALIYPSSGVCDYSVELPHWSFCSWFDVCWSFGVVGLEWYPCRRLKLQPATRIPLQPNHTETPTHIEPRTIRPMW